MTPPPGWYRDPSAPHLERWWDGTAWTEHRRPPEPVGYGPAAGTGGRGKAVAVTGAAAVLVASIVTGVFVLGEDDGGT
ncbi:DUF2510 domain-containing protein, partial [Streptomyces coelicoflavus]